MPLKAAHRARKVSSPQTVKIFAAGQPSPLRSAVSVAHEALFGESRMVRLFHDWPTSTHHLRKALIAVAGSFALCPWALLSSRPSNRLFGCSAGASSSQATAHGTEAAWQQCEDIGAEKSSFIEGPPIDSRDSQAHYECREQCNG